MALGTAMSSPFLPNCWVSFRVEDDVTSMVLFTKGAAEGLAVGGDVSETMGVKEMALGTAASSSFPPNRQKGFRVGDDISELRVEDTAGVADIWKIRRGL